MLAGEQAILGLRVCVREGAGHQGQVLGVEGIEVQGTRDEGPQALLRLKSNNAAAEG
jgi:hypothetical protein